MSDSNKPPKPPPPPDDFSKTTPNIKIPGTKGDSDWGKTNYRYPAQPASEEWGNTVANVRPFDSEDEDEFSRNPNPGSASPKVPDWGITRTDIKISEDDFGSGDNRESQNQEFGVTTPYFRLPEAERAKYQDIPPTPSEQAEQIEKEKKEKGGIPAWVWISGSLLAMFFFTIFVLLVIFVFFFNKTGAEIIVKDAPRGSSVRINSEAFWGESSPDGSITLPVLKAGQKNLEIIHPNYKCNPISINVTDGDTESVTAKCLQVASVSETCLEIKAGDYQTSRDCAYTELGKLSDPPDIEALLRAMNLYINHFDSGAHIIRPVDIKFLQTAASYMKKIPANTVIEVGGHTDADGEENANQGLSERRANAVKEALMAEGISSSMLVTKGYGELGPKADNKTDDGKFQNRRIEYKLAETRQ